MVIRHHLYIKNNLRASLKKKRERERITYERYEQRMNIILQFASKLLANRKISMKVLLCTIMLIWFILTVSFSSLVYQYVIKERKKEKQHNLRCKSHEIDWVWG